MRRAAAPPRRPAARTDGTHRRHAINGIEGKRLVRRVVAGNRVSGKERLLGERRQPLRDVREGPVGARYVVTGQANGELWRHRRAY